MWKQGARGRSKETIGAVFGRVARFGVTVGVRYNDRVCAVSSKGDRSVDRPGRRSPSTLVAR